MAALLSVATAANAGTYYVDSGASGSNDGSSWANAWTSLGSVAGVKAGDIVYISGGPSGSSRTYNSFNVPGYPGQWKPVGGTAGNPVTYKIGQDSTHNGTAIFSASGSGQWLGTINNVVISGDAGDGNMHFALSGYSLGAVLDSSSNARISYVNFGNIGTAANGQGVKGLEFDHCYIYISNSSADHGFSLGITDSAYDQSRIHHNTLYIPRNSNGLGADGIQTGGNGYSIYNNTIVAYLGYTGGQHSDGWQSTGGDYIKIHGNVFLNIANYPIYAGAYWASFNHLRIYNNILILSDPAIQASAPPAAVAVGPDRAGYSFSDVIIANNLADGYGSHPTFTLRDPAGWGTPFINSTVANNISINGGGPIIAPGVTNFGNVSMSVAAGASAFVQYTANGGLNNDFHLKAGATSLINQGANYSPFFTIDRDGNARPGSGTWELGPYEFGAGTPPANSPPSVTPVAVNAADVNAGVSGLQIYGGTVAQFSSSASDPDGTPLSWQWRYSVNGGADVIFLSGAGTVSNINFTFGTNTQGNTYVWTLSASDGTNSAQSQLTLSVQAPPAPGQGLTMAATSGTVSGFTLGAGGYIAQAQMVTDPNLGGSAVYTFVITNAGYYVIQAAINAPNDSANSVFVNIDAQPQDPVMIWDVVSMTSGFEPRLVSWRGTGTPDQNQFVPKFFNLTAGTHQLIIRGREANTQMQSFSLLQTPAPPPNLRVLTTVTPGPTFSTGF